MAQDLNTWQEIVLVATPALAALAAGASWASVLQTRQLRKEEEQPGLQVQLMSFPDHTIGAAVSNAGPGVARGVQIFLTHADFCVTGSIGHGFMFPGDTKIVLTPIPAAGRGINTRAIVSCRDRRSIPHAWDSHEHHRVSKTWRGKPRYQTLRAIFEGFYPGVDVEPLQEVEMRTTDERADSSSASPSPDGTSSTQTAERTR